MENFQNNKIGIAQLNPVLGDIEFNAGNIAKYIKQAESLGLDLIIFPELSLTGYPLLNIHEHYPILNKNINCWLNGIAKLCNKVTALVGYTDFFDNNTGLIAVLKNGKISNTFSSVTNKNNVIEINKTKYGIVIGEKNLHNSEILDNLYNSNIDVFINCIASTSNANKLNDRKHLLSSVSTKYKLPIIQVNQVGAIDDFSFDGNSLIYNNSNLIIKAKDFEEDFIITDLLEEQNIIQDNFNLKAQDKFSLNYEHDLERTYKTIIQGIRDYFKKCGLKRAVLGLSGGLDSSVCAVLLTDALGKENVYGISLPSKLTSFESKSDAKKLAENLGINFYEASIIPIINSINNEFNVLFDNIENNWNERYTHSYTQDNIQARSRALYLWSISNEFKSCIPIATSDKSELYMGYATINGDMSGGFAPIADVTKTKLFALARWLNKNRNSKNSIPEEIILKKPGAELAIDPKTGKTLNAEDALMPYEFLDEIIWRIENHNETYEKMLDAKFLYESKNTITKSQKIEWLDKFYARASRALYKWSILPPAIITDDKSINKNIYRQVITSGNIHYKEYTQEYADNILAGI